MEIIIALIVVIIAGLLWNANRRPETKVEAAPYKVEAPVVEAAVAPTVEEVVKTAETVATVVEEPAPAKKAPAKRAPVKKATATKVAAKKPAAVKAKAKPRTKKTA